MTSATRTDSAVLSRRTRLSAAFVGIGLLSMLLLASQLRPDPRGFGTHEQIGLPGCTFFLLVGRPCPACGMTTSWAHLTQGRPLTALRAHVAGTLLAAAAVVAVIFAVAMALIGRRPAWRPSEKAVAILAIGLVALILCEWMLRFFRA